MTPEQLVPTLETCLKLKKAGWKQETCFSWMNHMGIDQYTVVLSNHLQQLQFSRILAPTLQELLEKLPDWTLCFYNDVEYVVRSNIKAFEPIEQSHPNHAEAAALLWLELHTQHKEIQ
jgi:hypothetical protein